MSESAKSTVGMLVERIKELEEKCTRQEGQITDLLNGNDSLRAENNQLHEVVAQHAREIASAHEQLVHVLRNPLQDMSMSEINRLAISLTRGQVILERARRDGKPVQSPRKRPESPAKGRKAP